MAIEGDIQALLAPLVGGQCYPIVNTTSPITLPYITFQVVSNTPTVSLDGPNGLFNRRVQIDVFANSFGGAKALELQVNAAFTAAAFTNIPIFSFDQYEEEVKNFRVTLEYSIWSS